jgi:hypothetical protein
MLWWHMRFVKAAGSASRTRPLVRTRKRILLAKICDKYSGSIKRAGKKDRHSAAISYVAGASIRRQPKVPLL